MWSWEKHRQEKAGIQEWIDDIACCLMEGRYTNRSRLQKQLITLEKALRKLENRREAWVNIKHMGWEEWKKYGGVYRKTWN